MSDALSDGRRFGVCIVDDFTRECLALVADKSLTGRHVVRAPAFQDIYKERSREWAKLMFDLGARGPGARASSR